MIGRCIAFATALALATPAMAVDRDGVVATYADIGEAAYGDALTSAEALQAAVRALVADPTAQALDRAREAWRAARDPYMQTEAFRFANPIVDDWEGRVNSWPVDEGPDRLRLVRLLRLGRQRAGDAGRDRIPHVRAWRAHGGRLADHARPPFRHLAGGGGQRGQRRHGLARDRVPALGPGPRLDAARRGAAPVHRLRAGAGLHAWRL